jgi:hypothetical protein
MHEVWGKTKWGIYQVLANNSKYIDGNFHTQHILDKAVIRKMCKKIMQTESLFDLLILISSARITI